VMLLNTLTTCAVGQMLLQHLAAGWTVVHPRYRSVALWDVVARDEDRLARQRLRRYRRLGLRRDADHDYPASCRGLGRG
jgi:hypothetical protein